MCICVARVNQALHLGLSTPASELFRYLPVAFLVSVYISGKYLPDIGAILKNILHANEAGVDKTTTVKWRIVVY